MLVGALQHAVLIVTGNQPIQLFRYEDLLCLEHSTGKQARY